MADIKRVLQRRSPGKCLPRRIEGVRIGKIALVDQCGGILVDFPENRLGPVTARLTFSAQENLRRAAPVGREVLLVFENNDPGRPVIVDALYCQLGDIAAQSSGISEVQKPDEVTVDGKRVTFNAEKEIVLRCGEASITLTGAGKILFKGRYLTSRSCGANRIKGVSVQIN